LAEVQRKLCGACARGDEEFLSRVAKIARRYTAVRSCTANFRADMFMAARCAPDRRTGRQLNLKNLLVLNKYYFKNLGMAAPL
jgi:hypothetical protein